MEPLLSSRPIDFFTWEAGEAGFQAKLAAMLDEVTAAEDIFCYETKKGLCLIACREIVYVHSELKYVVIERASGQKERLFAKLSQIEAKLGGDFVRIHKSYLVNRRHVVWVNKADHTVKMTNGSVLSISEAHYKQALARLARLARE